MSPLRGFYYLLTIRSFLFFERNPSVICILFYHLLQNIFGVKTFCMKEEKRQQREEMMISLIEQWSESGKTQKVFCQEKGIAIATFYYWLKRHRQRLDEIRFFAG